MWHQVFEVSDIARVITLAFLELALSADNAIVLGVITRTLAPHLRSKALLIGIVSAFFFRAALILTIAFLFEFTWIQIIGALYLLYLCIRYFVKKPETEPSHSRYSFWKAVFFIEVIDLLFALDSIVAGLGFIDSNYSKIWIVYLGGVLGLIGMRFAATGFTYLLDYFPKLERSAYLIVGLVGLKLGLAGFSLHIPPLLFWVAVASFLGIGFIKKS